MHYTRHYLQSTRKERELEAMKDAKEFAGSRRVKEMVNAMAVEFGACKTFGQLKKKVRFMRKMLAMISGIAGVPATAMLRAAIRQCK